MTITLPSWPFVILTWAFCLLLVAGCLTLAVALLMRALKNRKVFRLGRIFLTCEKWRKEADAYTYTVLEECMRAMLADQPRNFYFMRDRLLTLKVEPETAETLADDLLRATELARRLPGMEIMVASLEVLEQKAREAIPETEPS